MNPSDFAIEYLASPFKNFKPWVGPDDGRSPQREFLRAAATHKTRIFRAGNQSGKTMISCVDAILRCVGWHPYARHKAPVRGWLVALDWEFGVGQVLWPTMRDWLPMSEVASILWYRKAVPEIPSAINFKNGSRIEFKSADSGRKKFQGAPLHFVGVDEEIPGDIVEECGARLVRHGGDFWAALTPLRRERWVLDKEQERGSVVIRSSMSQAAKAGILDTDAVDGYLETLPENQRRVRDMGDYAALEGLVYPEFSHEIHVVTPREPVLMASSGEVVHPWPLPAQWPRWAAIDFGYSHPTAVVQVAENPYDGRFYVERCLYASGIRASVWGGILREVLPPLSGPIIADHDRQEREELRARGVDTIPAKKDVIEGLEAVQRFLVGTPPRLRFVMSDVSPLRHPSVGRCDSHQLIREIESYRYPPSRSGDVASPQDLPLKRDDHACDALRYLVMFLERRRNRGPLRLHGVGRYDAQKSEEESWVERAYQSILPNEENFFG